MIDYEYYITVYDGKKIKSEEELESLLGEGRAYVRARAIPGACEEKLKNAVCAVCEVIYEYGDRRNIKSESADGVSVSYYRDNYEKLLENALRANTDSELLYRGLEVKGNIFGGIL